MKLLSISLNKIFDLVKLIISIIGDFKKKPSSEPLNDSTNDTTK